MGAIIIITKLTFMLQFWKLNLIDLVRPSNFALQNSDLSAMVAHHTAEDDQDEEHHSQ